MSTAAFTPAASRFAWKEYRMLRGLWLAVAALAMLEQLLSRTVSINASTLPGMLFASALFATVLYAVGAASIVFSVEHDEETYGFLTALPITSPPLFFGKLLVVTLSSLALAAALLLAGWAIGGSQWPSRDVAQGLLAACGVGIFEAIAWGTCFSLLVKRPLVAALLALLVGTISVQWIVSATSGAPPPRLRCRADVRQRAARRAMASRLIVAPVFRFNYQHCVNIIKSCRKIL
jgi:ABC-type transport system involved in multi-copper enzyme maturation permease subunit